MNRTVLIAILVCALTLLPSCAQTPPQTASADPGESDLQTRESPTLRTGDENGVDPMGNNAITPAKERDDGGIAPGVYHRDPTDKSYENAWLVLKESGVWYMYGFGSYTAVPHGKYTTDCDRLDCGALVFEQTEKDTLRLVSGVFVTGESPVEPGTKYVREEGSGANGVFGVTVDPGETDGSAWKTYICAKHGCSGIFSISFGGNGQCTYYEGLISSHLGLAEWTLEDGVLTVKEGRAVMHDDHKTYEMKDFCYRFAVNGDELTYLADVSDRFPMVRLEDKEIFFRV